MYSEGFEAEVWFSLRMQGLRMVDPQPPSIVEVRRVLVRYFPARTQRAMAHMIDVEDPSLWLDLIFKTDVLLRLQNIEGQSLRIAVDVTTNPTSAVPKLEMIRSRLFQAARKDLEIDQHWVVVVSPLALPSRDRLMDVVYEQADIGLEWAIIEF